jgi:hypothetical protein
LEPFDTKINCSGCLNLPQQQLSLSKMESNDPLSLLHQKKIKIKENKILKYGG